MNNFFKTLKLKKILTFCVVIGLIALFIANSSVYIEATRQGIKVWALTVLPSLLPFFFLTTLLTKTCNFSALCKHLNGFSKAIYNSNGISLYIRFISLISGYPVGAKIIADLYKGGIISSREAEKYCTFSSTSGPLFIVGAVAVGMYKNSFYGLIMLVSHYLSSALVGIIFRKLPDNRPIAPLFNDFGCDNVLYESMYSSVVSVLLVGGFCSVFYTFAEMASDIGLLIPLNKLLSLFLDKDLSSSFTIGLIECTHGILNLSLCDKGILSASLSCTLISFGGISVWLQSLAYLKAAKVRTKIFIWSKILHTVITFFVCYTLLYLL